MKASVVVTTFQHADYIEAAIRSVLSQNTDFPFEIIIGDDASSDGTVDKLLSLQAEAPDIVRLHLSETNGGDRGVANFWSVLNAAKGDFIAILDGDDYWTSQDKLQRQVDFLTKNTDCDLVTHRAVHVYENGDSLVSPRPHCGDGVLPLQMLIKTNFAEKSTLMVRRNTLKNLPDWYRKTETISYDWEFSVLTGQFGNIGYIDRFMSAHRLQSESMTLRYGTSALMQNKLVAIDRLISEMPLHRSSLKAAKRIINMKMMARRISPMLYHNVKRLRNIRATHG